MTALKIKQQLVTSTRLVTSGKNPGRLIGFHETDNTRPTATAQAHADLQTNGNTRDVSWQWQVDEVIAIQSFRNDQKCWHAGDGINGIGLHESIAVEVCVNGDVKKAWENAAKLGAILLEDPEIEASTIDDLRQHFDFSGKNCPQLLRAGEHGLSWEWFLAEVSKHLSGGNTTVSKPTYTMVSPVQGYLTQNFIPRKHLGIDIGTGGKQMPVYASFPGRVVQIIRDTPVGNMSSTYAPGRTSNVVIVQNTGRGTSNDNEYQAYGHVTAHSGLQVGDQVKAGEYIGDLDRSGNTTGWHLHLETWTAGKVPYNPRLAFDRWGVKVGSKPKTNAKPKPKPVTPKPKKPVQGSAKIRKIQQDLNKYANAGLYVDGVNGKVTKAWVKWVKDAQRTHLPAWRGVPKLVVDGHYGPVMSGAVKTLQRRNGLVPDGVLGPVTINFMRRHGSKIKNRPSNRP